MTTGSHKNTILDATQVKQKINRIACEIYENNFTETQIVLAGINDQGYRLAQRISKELRALTTMDVKMVKISVSKPISQSWSVTIDCKLDELKKKCIILIDDVLNTGKTLVFGLKPILSVEVKKIEVAVLVNRSHTLFPIQPKYTGLALSTTLDEHVEVVLTKKNVVYLY